MYEETTSSLCPLGGFHARSRAELAKKFFELETDLIMRRGLRYREYQRR
jgi:hypothetical protein